MINVHTSFHWVGEGYENARIRNEKGGMRSVRARGLGWGECRGRRDDFKEGERN